MSHSFLQQIICNMGEALSAASQPSDKASIIVGIDYGTTYVSVAWTSFQPALGSATFADIDQAAQQVRLVTRWPGGMSEVPQAPTKLLYRLNEPPYPDVKWGYPAERRSRIAGEDSVAVALAKLSLHECEETRVEFDRISALQDQLRRNFVVDFLIGLRGWLTSMPRPGPFHSRGASNARVSYVFGVPAAWSDGEQDKMLQYAREAEFSNGNDDVELSFAAEPEAMAIAYLATEDHGLNVWLHSFVRLTI